MPIKTPSNVSKRERWNQLPIVLSYFNRVCSIIDFCIFNRPFKRFGWIVLFIALSTRNWVRVIVSVVIEHHYCGLMKMLEAKERTNPFRWCTFEKPFSWFDRDPKLFVELKKEDCCVTRLELKIDIFFWLHLLRKSWHHNSLRQM